MKLITVMIIDDEPIIRDKLRHIIDWRKLGCEIVAEADNGAYALKVCRELKPQIIVSDIYMPLMDGVAFSTQIKKVLPECVIILISGFNDFNYAQRALNTGVFRYLLKPLKAKELWEIINEAKELILVRKQEAEEKAQLKKVINRSLPALREKFFSDLIKGELDPKKIIEQLNFLQLTPSGEFFGVITANLDNYKNLTETITIEELQLFKFHLMKMVKNILKSKVEFCFCFINKPHEIVVIYSLNQLERTEEIYQNLLFTQEKFSAIYNLTFSAGIGGIYQEFSSIKTSYQEANLALDFKMWTGTNALIPYTDLETSQTGRLLYSEEHEFFTSALRQGNLEKAEVLIEKVFTTLKSHEYLYLTKSLLHLTVLDLVNHIIRTLLEFGGKVEVIEEIFGVGFNPLEEVDRYETLDALEKWVKNLTSQASAFINHHKQEIGKHFVEKARQYLEDNFTRPELNLNAVAEHVYVSSCYLSHLFKEVTGNNVTEYLNRVRIKKAKQLLKDTNLKIYEIADQVGFRDSHYFGIVFKKMIGLSPGEYRDKVQITQSL